jgi:hypothetical protein
MENIMEDLRPARPDRRWSVDAFEAFWSKPDPAKVAGVLTRDVVGHWPRPIGLVRGASDYVDVIKAILKLCPDFRLELGEHAVSGNFAFLRWVASGNGPGGPFAFTGCDRVQTRNGHVCENFIFCDHPFFARVGGELRKAREERRVADEVSLVRAET